MLARLVVPGLPVPEREPGQPDGLFFNACPLYFERLELQARLTLCMSCAMPSLDPFRPCRKMSQAVCIQHSQSGPGQGHRKVVDQ